VGATLRDVLNARCDLGRCGTDTSARGRELASGPTRRTDELADLEPELVEDLDAAEEAEDVRGGTTWHPERELAALAEGARTDPSVTQEAR
jgi:hypothetical protein